MSEQEFSNLYLDIDPVESASISEDAANVLVQLESWYQARIDKIEEVARMDCDKLDINGSVTDSPAFIDGFQAGLLMATQMMGSLPISLSE